VTKELLGSLELNRIYQMDCIEGMKLIPDKSIDMILCDLPYGTTACKWDTVIPLEPLWEQYMRIIKDNGAILLFGTEPFSSQLRMSNIKNYKYDWIWVKTVPSGFQHAKNKPMNAYENISVFSKAPMGHESLLGDKRMVYYPQGLQDTYEEERGQKFKNVVGQRPSHKQSFVRTKTNYPRNVLYYPNQSGELAQGKRLHPTQKPMELCEYLIRTYTKEGEIVLDNCMGSGTTAVAALKTNRRFIGFETEPRYIEIANKRIEAVLSDD
jgi:site-specific DNA-methyltransferase (adenine-specific)